MRAFVVRPFGTKEGVDFDRVEKELIAPAFKLAGVTGSTTGEIVASGSIHKGMFELLLTADLVVADITIHNANVFYELGIRHARRRRGTLLLRGTLPPEARKDVPFDVVGYRYLAYDLGEPGPTVAALVDSLQATLAGEEDDSPIYALLASHQEDLPGELPPPSTFKEDVEKAFASKDAGMLALLAEEAQTFAWARAALRQVGRALSSLTAYESARDAWKQITKVTPDDYEANKHLGNVYHRLGDLPESTQALQRVAEKRSAAGSQRAEAVAQQGRNAKVLWRREWSGLADLAQRREAALQSPGLAEALDLYRNAFKEDLNEYYPGVNALALQVISGELSGEAGPNQARVEATTMVRAAVDRARERAAAEKKVDRWAEATFADSTFLTSDDPAAVEKEYRRVLWRSSEFDRDAVRRQLELFGLLELREKVLEAAFRAVGPPISAEGYERVLLFTGHRLDAPGRAEPRFPAAKEPAARAQIKARVEAELQKTQGRTIGIAGAASGGDILFHEVCLELGIPSLIYLAIPPPQYVAQSVQDAGPGWVERFNALLKTRPQPKVLCPDGSLPGWLQTRKGYGIWQRSNRWMLRSALASGYQKVTLIALWDGKDKGDGPGGTADLIRSADGHGARQEVIKTTEL